MCVNPMSTWRQLELAVNLALTVSIELPVVPELLVSEIETLKRVLRTAGNGQPPRDRLREAVRHFLATGQLPNLAAARSVCFGAAERFTQAEPPVIEDGNAFPRLLSGVDEYRDAPRHYRRCYRGLLHTYFIYHGEHDETPKTGRRNWIQLRDYLHARRPSIRVAGFRPEWAEAIDDHPNLLTDDPVSKYASEVLNGNTETVDLIRSRLEVSDASWLMRKLIVAQIRAATLESDESFRRRVQTLLKLLEGHEILENDGLTLILDRYAKMRIPEPHIGLRDRTVQSWGNPWLDRNSPKWTRVTPDARRLVSNWLKLDLIREFFEALSEDRKTDQRRVSFWEQYHEQIDDMYFALGSATMSARSADAKRLRDRMGDHLLGLKRPGASANNAFIMMMGEIVAVEFGVRGNACYLYQRNTLPFQLQGEVTGDRDGLRSHSNIERLLHMDSGHETWEEKFSSVLSRHGISRGSKPQVKLTRAAAATSSQVALRSQQQGGGESPTKRQFKEFVDRYTMSWNDNTSVGGNLAVKHPYTIGAIADQLRAWGFSYSETRKFWYRKDWH
jgi:hypothetical protein